jgi:hypothetical protein
LPIFRSHDYPTPVSWQVSGILGGQAKAAIRGHLKTGHREKP